MTNNSSLTRKRNNNVNTAHFLISRFLSHPISLAFKLNGNTQSLFRHLGDLMDKNLSAYGTRICTIKITQLCSQAGMSDKPATKAIRDLIDKKLINLVRKIERNKAVYELGEILSVSENLRNWSESVSEISPVSFGDLADQFRRISETHIYNTSYNTSYNTEMASQKEKTKGQKTIQHRDDPSPLLAEYMNKH